VNYTATWLPAAENELATIWMASADRTAVTQAAAELDRRLAANGPDEGESRPGKRRITFVRPLAIIFEYDISARTVTVGQVWEFR
jgi:hypothetical protein